jgi:flagellar motor switch protein FliM
MIQATPDLNEQLVRELMDRARTTPTDLQAPQGLREYDWQAPHRFNPRQIERFGRFYRNLAHELGQTMTRVMREEVTFQALGMSEHYGRSLRPAEGRNELFALLSDPNEEDIIGEMVFETVNTLSWVGRLLGSGKFQGQARDRLSPLESELIFELSLGMVKTVNDVCAELEGPQVRQRPELFEGTNPLVEDAEEEFVRFDFACTTDPDNAVVSLVLRTNQVAPLVGMDIQEAQAGRDQLKRDILWHLEQVRLRGEVQLGKVDVPIRALLDLAPGDVLLIHQKAVDPVELVVQGQAYMKGYPVRCSGRYGLFIVEAETLEDDIAAAEANKKPKKPANKADKG